MTISASEGRGVAEFVAEGSATHSMESRERPNLVKSPIKLIQSS